jgi:hypothetical protein
MPRLVWSQFHPHAPSLRASRGPASARPDGERAPAPRRRSRERGQVIPLVALCLVVLTGFAALAIDAGMGYDRSRNDQDVADSAALAASYWVNYNATSGDSLSGAYTAAKNVADINCTNGSGPCTNNFTLTIYSSFGSTNTVITNVGMSGSNVGCSSSINGPFTSACPDVSGADTDVGAAISNTASDNLANLGQPGSRTYTVAASAVAQVQGSGLQVLQCQLCVLGSGGLNFDLGLFASASVITDNNADVYVNYNITCSGFFSAINFTTSPLYTYVGGSVSTSLCSGNFTPSAKTGQPKIADPLLNMKMPVVGTTNCGTISSTSYTSPCATWPSGAGKSPLDLTPGNYGTLALSGSWWTGITVNFAPGLYVFAGNSSSGIQVTGENLTLNGTGITLYFMCGTSALPAACTSGQDGATYDENSGVTLTQQLSAPTSGPQQDVLFIFDRNNASTIDEATWFEFMSDSGALYAPAATYTNEALYDGNAIASPVVIGSMTVGSGGLFTGYGFSMDGDPIVPGGLGGLVQ